MSRCWCGGRGYELQEQVEVALGPDGVLRASRDSILLIDLCPCQWRTVDPSRRDTASVTRDT